VSGTGKSGVDKPDQSAILHPRIGLGNTNTPAKELFVSPLSWLLRLGGHE
jgi:hypothetical protein